MPLETDVDSSIAGSLPYHIVSFVMPHFIHHNMLFFFEFCKACVVITKNGHHPRYVAPLFIG